MSSAKLNRHRSFITLFVSCFLILGTIAAIYFARGYRLNPRQGLNALHGTGLLSATSYPKSAQVYIDDKLVTATEDTLNLAPGEYSVKITKEGFLPWTKKLTIKEELVTPTDARLFPAAPSLSALTYSGAYNPTPSPDGKRLVFVSTNSEDSTKNGLYITDINNSILNLDRTPSLIVPNTDRYELSEAIITWSPDSKNLMIAFTEGEDEDLKLTHTFLISADSTTNLNSTPDATIRLPIIFSDWEQELIRNQQTLLKKLPEFMQDLATSSAENIYFSPDGEKMLYTATKEITISDGLIKPLASINSTPQTRQLQPGFRYVYDLKEDTNYEIGPAPETQDHFTPKVILTNPTSPTPEPAATLSANQEPIYDQLQKDRSPLETIFAFKTHYTALYTNNPQWYPTSRHLISTDDSKITIFEYDGLNPTVVYSGPFDPGFVYPSPGGDRLLILTNLNQDDQPLNLYTLNLK